MATLWQFEGYNHTENLFTDQTTPAGVRPNHLSLELNNHPIARAFPAIGVTASRAARPPCNAGLWYGRPYHVTQTTN